MKPITLGILSAKGGVGKTTTAINLGQAFHEFGRKVLVIDANYTKPNIGLHLGITKQDAHINHALKGRHKILEAHCKHHSGLEIIPGSLIFEEACGSNSHKIKDLIDDVAPYFEITILDTAPTFGHELFEVLEAVSHAIIITTSDISSITDGLRTKKLLEEKHISLLGVVVTKQTTSSQYSLHDIELLFNLPVIGSISYDEQILLSQDKKTPLVFFNSSSKAAIEYKKLAANIIGEEYDAEYRPSSFEYILKRLGLR